MPPSLPRPVTIDDRDSAVVSSRGDGRVTPLSELSYPAKVRLVTLLAQFSGPAEAARVVSEEFSVILDRRTAWKYDASKPGCKTGPRLRQLFAAVRNRWLEDVASIGIAHQAHRLRVLDRLAQKLEHDGDYLGAARVLEQAAKEAGGLYTNVRKAAVAATLNLAPADAEGAREMLTARLAAMIEDHSKVAADNERPEAAAASSASLS